MIHIDQCQRSNSAPGKSFHSPGAHTADPYNSDMRIAKAPSRLNSKEPVHAGKPAVEFSCLNRP
jgi:hypothetical protein